MFYIWDKRLNYNWGSYFSTKEEADNALVHFVSRNAMYTLADLIIKERDDSPEYMEVRMLMEDGTYQPTVWAQQPWYLERKDDINTFEHIDVDKPENILFFESRAKLQKGRTTPIKPGKYLKKYFGDILTEQDILHWTNVHKEQWVDGSELHWAETPEEIVKVYEMDAMFASCMQHKFPKDGVSRNTASWPRDLPCHPVSAYGAGDLSLAYLHKGDRLVGRALVWKEKGLVGRVYGDIVGMRTALRKAGFPTDSDQNNYDTFEGARLLHIPYPYSEEHIREEYVYTELPRVVSPYIDGRIDGLVFDEKKEFLILTDQGWDDDFIQCENPATFKASDAGGYVYGTCTCAKCGKDKRAFNFLYTKVEGQDEPVKVWWCTNCFDRHTTYSERHGKHYDKAHFQQVRVYYNGYWGESSRWAVEGIDAYVMTLEGLHRAEEDCTKLEDGTYVGTHVLSRHAFESVIDGKLYPNSMKADTTETFNRFKGWYAMTKEQLATFTEDLSMEEFLAQKGSKRPTLETIKESLFGSWL